MAVGTWASTGCLSCSCKSFPIQINSHFCHLVVHCKMFYLHGWLLSLELQVWPAYEMVGILYNTWYSCCPLYARNVCLPPFYVVTCVYRIVRYFSSDSIISTVSVLNFFSALLKSWPSYLAITIKCLFSTRCLNGNEKEQRSVWSKCHHLPGSEYSLPSEAKENAVPDI